MEQLAGLNNDYQILTELYRSGETRTFLARHLTLNRDVTVTVARASGDRSFLEAFANDAEILKTQRNPNIVPVLESRWLDSNTLAVVRARVRGSNLDQLVSAVGAMPAAKISAALREITTALLFARNAGVTNRFVSPESLVFQQGTGRPLIAFEPSRLVTDDSQTIRELASRMNAGAPFDVSEFIAMLTGTPVRSAPVVAAPVVSQPVGRDEPVVVTQRSGMSFGARVLTTFAILGVLIIAAVMFVRNRQSNQPTRSASATVDTTLPNTTDAAGDIALHSTRPDTMVYPTPTIVEPPQPTQQPMPQQQMPAPIPTPAPAQPSTLPSTQPVAPPAPVTREPKEPVVPIDTVVRAPRGDVCDSPVESDQHQCLVSAIEKSDRDLNATYQRLINALRKQAGVADDQPDPPAVEELRATQRRWLADRDDVCRGTGSGLLYARDRAACFADRSAQRTRDLQSQLDAIP